MTEWWKQPKTDDNVFAQVQATYNTVTRVPQRVEVAIRFATIERAREVAALFPKSVRARASRVSSTPNYAAVYVFVNLTADGVNKGINEAGIKRYRTACKHLAKNGFRVEWIKSFANGYELEQDFEEALINAKEATNG